MQSINCSLAQVGELNVNNNANPLETCHDEVRSFYPFKTRNVHSNFQFKLLKQTWFIDVRLFVKRKKISKAII